MALALHLFQLRIYEKSDRERQKRIDVLPTRVPVVLNCISGGKNLHVTVNTVKISSG